MLEKDRKTEHGVVKIHNDVISQIAIIASKEIKGVVDIDKGCIANFFETIFNKPLFSKGVKVEVMDDNDIRICISLIVEYGCDISLVATNVQENVKDRLEHIASLNLIEVNVNVKQVRFTRKANL